MFTAYCSKPLSRTDRIYVRFNDKNIVSSLCVWNYIRFKHLLQNAGLVYLFALFYCERISNGI